MATHAPRAATATATRVTPGRLLRESWRIITGRRRVFYGWWVLAASFVAIGLINGVAFWSVGLFIEPLEDEFGWSRAQVSLGFSLSLGLSGLGAPFVGRWIDRRGPRSGILLGATATAATYLLLATTQTLWQWYLYLALNGLLRHFVFIIPYMALVSRWFDRKRSIAAGILAAGLMVGGMAVVPLMRLVLDLVEWRGAFIFAAVLTGGASAIFAILVIRNRPEDIGTVPDGSLPPEGYQRAAHASATTGGLTLGEAMRTRIFWALAAGLILFPFGMITWISHAAPFYESVGFSSGAAAGLVSLSAALAIPPRLLAGFFADRLPRLELGAAAVGLLLALSMAILVVDSSLLGIALFFPLFVFGFATGGALFEGLLIPRAFGVQHYATILGTIVIMQTAGFILGPTIAGAIYDETGSYRWALVMMSVLFLGTGLSFAVASRLPRPHIPTRESDA